MTQTQAVKTFYTDTEKRGRIGHTIREYMGFFDESNGGGIEARPREESFEASLARAERYIALRPEEVNHDESQLEKVRGHNQEAGLSHLCSAFKGEVLDSFDAATRSDPQTPWYRPLLGELTLPGLRRGRLGRRIARRTIGGLEALGIAPKGSQEVSRMLGRAAGADQEWYLQFYLAPEASAPLRIAR